MLIDFVFLFALVRLTIASFASHHYIHFSCFFFFQAEDGIRDGHETGVQTCALPIYIVGTVVAWLPIPILFGMVLGGIGVADELTVGDELRVTTDVSAYIFGENFGSVGSLLFSMTIFMAGLTTAGNSLAGFQAAMAVDVQEGVMRSDRTSRQRKRFTQIATLVFGLVTCVGALALEGVSLLRVDIVSGIVFASPIGALLIGMFWRRPSAPLAIGSVLVGVCSGLIAYIVIDDPDIDYFI